MHFHFHQPTGTFHKRFPMALKRLQGDVVSAKRLAFSAAADDDDDDVQFIRTVYLIDDDRAAVDINAGARIPAPEEHESAEQIATEEEEEEEEEEGEDKHEAGKDNAAKEKEAEGRESPELTVPEEEEEGEEKEKEDEDDQVEGKLCQKNRDNYRLLVQSLSPMMEEVPETPQPETMQPPPASGDIHDTTDNFEVSADIDDSELADDESGVEIDAAAAEAEATTKKEDSLDSVTPGEKEEERNTHHANAMEVENSDSAPAAAIISKSDLEESDSEESTLPKPASFFKIPFEDISDDDDDDSGKKTSAACAASDTAAAAAAAAAAATPLNFNRRPLGFEDISDDEVDQRQDSSEGEAALLEYRARQEAVNHVISERHMVRF